MKGSSNQCWLTYVDSNHRFLLQQTHIEIAIKEIETQKQIEKLVSESTTDESTRALLKENIASSISTHNFNTELERH